MGDWTEMGTRSMLERPIKMRLQFTRGRVGGKGKMDLGGQGVWGSIQVGSGSERQMVQRQHGERGRLDTMLGRGHAVRGAIAAARRQQNVVGGTPGDGVQQCILRGEAAEERPGCLSLPQVFIASTAQPVRFNMYSRWYLL